MTDCKYGDPTCPCQDGDMCHYKAGWVTKAMPVPAEYADAALAKKDEEIERLRAALGMVKAAVALKGWGGLANQISSILATPVDGEKS